MSIICTVYLPEGIVMAAESRLTGIRTTSEKETTNISKFALSDNYQKIVLLDKVKVGISFCGDLIIQGKTVADFLRIFEIEKVEKDDTVEIITRKLVDFLKGHNTTKFFLCGYENDVPFFYVISPKVVRRNINDQGNITYGSSWNGQVSAISRLINTDPTTRINFGLMPLKDGIDLAEFLIETTIKYERFQEDIQTCGGPIDILILTKDDVFWYKHKIFK